MRLLPGDEGSAGQAVPVSDSDRTEVVTEVVLFSVQMKANDRQIVEANVWQGGVLVRFQDGESAYFQGYLLHAARELAKVLQIREDEQADDKPVVTD